MTPRAADKAIRAGLPVTLRNNFYGDGAAFTVTLVSRDRWNVYTADGEKYDRGELEIIRLTTAHTWDNREFSLGDVCRFKARHADASVGRLVLREIISANIGLFQVGETDELKSYEFGLIQLESPGEVTR